MQNVESVTTQYGSARSGERVTARVVHSEEASPEELEKRAWVALTERAAKDDAVRELNEFRRASVGGIRVGEKWLRFTEFSAVAVRRFDVDSDLVLGGDDAAERVKRALQGGNG